MNRRQQVLVTARDRRGALLDVTHHCQLRLDAPAARLQGTLLIGQQDGHANLLVKFGAAELQVPIEVAGFDHYPPVHFQHDIVPLLSKLGCNSGGCHGKQSGQNGFKLSVFGFDTDADYHALVMEARGRRIFPGDPDHSLLMRKATGQIPHGGGARVEEESEDCQLLRQWILQGMPRGAADAAALVGITVEPAERILAMHADQQILVTAMFSDGQSRDVTAAAAYASNAEDVAAVDAGGHVLTGNRPGESAITVNYMGQVATVRILVPRPRTGAITAVPFDDQSIDGLVHQKLAKLGLEASPSCDDSIFMRRVYLHVLGQLPQADRVVEFLADQSPDKRARLIDEVLEQPGYADYWALKWADILMVNEDTLGPRGAFEFHQWLRTQFALNRPYDQWARELILASGDSAKSGAVNFHRGLATADDAARVISQALLGIRMDCAQCHHHPFEKWSQHDFYGLAGYFTGMTKKPLEAGRDMIYHAGYQPAQLPLTGQPVVTRPPDGPPLEAAQYAHADPRIHLADWMTAQDNPYFARLLANRLWKHFLGRGLVEPEDDLRTTNPATNEPLLDHLTQTVVRERFDIKAVMRHILRSQAYQRSSEIRAGNEGDGQNFSRYLVRRLPAEVLLDSISQVTGSPELFPGAAPGTRAVELWDNGLPSYFLETFGRSLRTSPCACGKSDEPTMAQALHLLNAPEIDAKIVSPQGHIAIWFAKGQSFDQVIERLTLLALCRPPSETQWAIARSLQAAEPAPQAAEDYLWSLLNSYDFLFIH